MTFFTKTLENHGILVVGARTICWVGWGPMVAGGIGLCLSEGEGASR